MKPVLVGFLLLCAVCSPLVAQSKTDQYQAGKIVSVDNRPVQDTSSGPNPPLESNIADHDLSIQVGDTIYVGRFHSMKDQDISWMRDKDVQVKVKGKVMHIKRVTGPDTTVSIMSASKATER